MRRVIFLFLISLLYLPALCGQPVIGVPDKQEFSLEGPWGYFSDEILSPSEISIPTNFVDFPAQWDHSFGCATYVVQVEIPDTTENWALFLPPAYSAFRCYWNGAELAANGTVACSEEDSKPSWKHITQEIPPSLLKEKNQLVFQISNYHHAKGGPANSIVIGKAAYMLHKHKMINYVDIFLAGALFMGGMFFMGLFLHDKARNNILYFSLFSFSFAFHVVGSHNHAILSIIPSMPWGLGVKLEYASLYLSVMFLTLYVAHSFKEEAKAFLYRPFVYFNILYVGVAIFFPIDWLTSIHVFYLIYAFLMVLVAMYIKVKAFVQRRTGAGFAIWAILLFVLAMSARLLDILGVIGQSVYLVPIGYAVFFFLHFLSLSYQYAENWQRAKEEAESSLKAKSDFLSVISHEIRTPLNAVIGMANHLQMGHPRHDQVETIDSLKFSSEYLLSLINNILDFNKIEAGKITFVNSNFNLFNLAQQLVTGFKAKGAERNNVIFLETDFDDATSIIADKGKLSQVLGNLLGNAVKFTRNGEVTLKVSQLSKSQDTVAFRFEVIDTGIGIAEDKLEFIFDSFNQAERGVHEIYGGTGLGLTITKRILDLQGVEIKVASTIDIGTTFSFEQTFKLGENISPKMQSALEPEKGFYLDGKHLLLVEDNALNVLVVKKYLATWGVRFTLAENGQRALDLFDHHEHDLILMDIQMPVMDGFEASRLLRKQGCEVPIIALTASSSEAIIVNIEDAGMNDYVIKPYHPDELFNKLREYLIR